MCVCVCVCVCAGINVPRSRFLPVKKTSDLLVVMSNLFQLRDGTLVQNPARLYPELPLVKLGEQFFMKVRTAIAVVYMLLVMRPRSPSKTGRVVLYESEDGDCRCLRAVSYEASIP